MTIWQMSLLASVIILATIVIRSLALHKIPKNTFLVLWGLALIRLLIPFRFSVYLPFHVFDIPGISQLQEISQFNMGDITVTQNTPTMELTANALAIPLPLLIWLSVAICILLYFIVNHMRYSRAYKLAVPTNNEYTNEWLQRNALKWRTVKIKVSTDISAPLTYGLFHPIILIPKATDIGNREQLKYILTHEMIHIRRFDTLWKWLLMIAVCVHWFNPFVWIMYIFASRDLEITCDEKVIRVMGENNKSTYVLTLIELAEEQAKIIPLGIAFSKNAIEERTISIMKMKKTTTLGIALAVVAVISIGAVTAAFATSSTNTSDRTAEAEFYARLLPDVPSVEVDSAPGVDNFPNAHLYTESIEGERITVNGYEDDFSFPSISVNCVNGVANKHIRDNGQMAIYTNDGEVWKLKSGQKVTLTFDVTDDDWWGLIIGYEKDGEYIRYGYDPTLVTDQRYIISGETAVEFIAPEDGEYCFFMVNMSAGPVYVNSVTISE